MRRVFVWPLFLAACTVCGAEPLGRLFYTPAQREQLDVLRSQKNIAPQPAEPAEPVVVPEVVKYDGIVRRSDGKTTVWINNRAIVDGKPTGDLPIRARVRPDHRLSVTVPQVEKSIDLKVGQSAEVLSGSVTESYVHRKLDVKTPETTPAAANTRATPTSKPALDDENGEPARR